MSHFEAMDMFEWYETKSMIIINFLFGAEILTFKNWNFDIIFWCFVSKKSSTIRIKKLFKPLLPENECPKALLLHFLRRHYYCISYSHIALSKSPTNTSILYDSNMTMQFKRKLLRGTCSSVKHNHSAVQHTTGNITCAH